tara:strand:- start:149 stop:943 length:795 start_codon:yes stop_codon:yes gene_type:complete
MAKSTVGLGTANQGDGDPIRTAFSKLNDNHTELYSLLGNGTTLSVTGDVAISSGAATIQADSVEGSMINDNAISGQAEMTGDVADADELMVSDGGTLKRADFSVVRDAVFNDVSGDATVAAGGAITIANGAVENAMLADNAVDHDELANRYTRVQDIASTTGTIDLECDDYAVFNLTGNLGTCNIKLKDIKTAQVVDVICSGSDLSSANITLQTNFSTVAINKVGTTNFDTSKFNHFVFSCIDDTDGDAIINYTVNEFAADTTP